MNIQRSVVIWCRVLVLPVLLQVGISSAQDHRHSKRTHICAEPTPQAMCNASNTCESPSAPCRIDVKRTDYGASATPALPGAKSNAPICVKAGTIVTWHSASKNTGFTVDFGPSSPFDPAGAIIGGSDRSVSVTAKKEGCYKYSVGACDTDAIYGMCAEGTAELILIGAGTQAPQ